MLADTLKPTYREGFIKAIDGVELFYREWSPANTGVTSVILFIHGIGLHGGSAPYGEKIILPKLLEQGAAFYLIDLRGHGKSGGGTDKIMQYTLISDISRHIKNIKASYENAAIILYGHNIGGILSLYYASQLPKSVRCVIVSVYSRRTRESIKRLRQPNATMAIVDRIVKKIYRRPKRYEFLTPPEYERLCARYNIPLDNDILDSLESAGGVEKCAIYRKEFFSACGAGLEQQIVKNVHVPALMIFSRKDPFFEEKGAYDILTNIRSLDKELQHVETTCHYHIIEASGDIISKWVSSRISQVTDK